MRWKEPKIKNNLTIVKLFDSGSNEPKKLRITTMSGTRVSGVEDPYEQPRGHNSSADRKLEESIIRTRSKIFELAYCNSWEWFFTGTLDPKKFDREDLETYHKKLTSFIRNYNQKHSLSIKFLLIPEKHADGRTWHMHGFFLGLPEEFLHEFHLGETCGVGIAQKLIKGEKVWNWGDYQKKFGFCSLERIKNKEAVSNYVRKYISKDLGKSVREVNAHMYYRSRGLRESVQVGRGFLPAGFLGKPSYEGEYTTTWWLDATPELLQALRDNLSEEVFDLHFTDCISK